MQHKFAKQYTSSYKTDKLKDRLQRHFRGIIHVWQSNYRSDLVYSRKILKGKAIQAAFKLVSTDERIIWECTMNLRHNIIEFQNDKTINEWPCALTLRLHMSALPICAVIAIRSKPGPASQ